MRAIKKHVLVWSLGFICTSWHARADFTVDQLTDLPDMNIGDGICAANINAVNKCTLRAALQEANQNKANDIIKIEVQGTYKISIADMNNTPEDSAKSGDLDIQPDNDHTLTIIGIDPNSTHISGDNKYRVIEVVGSAANVTLKNLSIEQGRDLVGAGISNVGKLSLQNVKITGNNAVQSVNFPSGYGGGIYNDGELNILFGDISNNSADPVNGTLLGGAGIYNDKDAILILDQTVMQKNAVNGNYYGGAINNYAGQVSISNTSITDNSSGRGSGVANLSDTTSEIKASAKLTIKNSVLNSNHTNGSGYGGGIYDRNGVVQIENTTIAENSASGGSAIYKYDNSDAVARGLKIRNATIARNPASSSGGGGIYLQAFVKSNLPSIKNTILEGNTAAQNPQDCYAGFFPLSEFISEGYNIFGEVESCDINTSEGDWLGISPELDEQLANHGGPTLTYALLPGSLAIDGGNPNGCEGLDGKLLTTDQRGFLRNDGHCDIGAFENVTCGNGAIDPGEECDDQNSNNTDACVACIVAKCGDGFVQVGIEECDDGNLSDNDGCSASCVKEVAATETATETEVGSATLTGTDTASGGDGGGCSLGASGASWSLMGFGLLGALALAKRRHS